MNPKISQYIHELKKYNETTNIYSKTAYHHLNFHIQDCIGIANIIPPNTQSILDMGSGSGLPAVPLSILLPHTKITAIESKGRKARFLFHVKQTLSLANLTIINADIHQVLQESNVTADVITAKAFAPFKKAQSIATKAKKTGSILIIPISPAQYDTHSESPPNHTTFIKHPELNTYYLVAKL